MTSFISVSLLPKLSLVKLYDNCTKHKTTPRKQSHSKISAHHQDIKIISPFYNWQENVKFPCQCAYHRIKRYKEKTNVLKHCQNKNLKNELSIYKNRIAAAVRESSQNSKIKIQQKMTIEGTRHYRKTEDPKREVDYSHKKRTSYQPQRDYLDHYNHLFMEILRKRMQPMNDHEKISKLIKFIKLQSKVDQKYLQRVRQPILMHLLRASQKNSFDAILHANSQSSQIMSSICRILNCKQQYGLEFIEGVQKAMNDMELFLIKQVENKLLSKSQKPVPFIQIKEPNPIKQTFNIQEPHIKPAESSKNKNYSQSSSSETLMYLTEKYDHSGQVKQQQHIPNIKSSSQDQNSAHLKTVSLSESSSKKVFDMQKKYQSRVSILSNVTPNNEQITKPITEKQYYSHNESLRLVEKDNQNSNPTIKGTEHKLNNVSNKLLKHKNKQNLFPFESSIIKTKTSIHRIQSTTSFTKKQPTVRFIPVSSTKVTSKKIEADKSNQALPSGKSIQKSGRSKKKIVIKQQKINSFELIKYEPIFTVDQFTKTRKIIQNDELSDEQKMNEVFDMISPRLEQEVQLVDQFIERFEPVLKQEQKKILTTKKRKYFHDKMILELTVQVDKCLKELKQADDQVWKYEDHDDFTSFYPGMRKVIDIEILPDSEVNLTDQFTKFKVVESFVSQQQQTKQKNLAQKSTQTLQQIKLGELEIKELLIEGEKRKSKTKLKLKKSQRMSKSCILEDEVLKIDKHKQILRYMKSNHPFTFSEISENIKDTLIV